MQLSNHPLAWQKQSAFKKRLTFAEVAKDRKRTSSADVGTMLLFKYDPKHKKTLPYYDTYPLIFVINPDKPGAKGEPGFLGLNFHYLDVKNRFKLLDSLMETMTDKRYDENTRLDISWQIIQSVVKDPRVGPTVHHYLMPHVRSTFVQITSDEWDVAVALPVQKFQKKSDEYVWRQSKKKF